MAPLEMNSKRKTLLLPEEILEDILVRIPVKSLLRLRCVSRSWLSLIDSKQFTKAHLQYSNKNQRVIIYTGGEPKQCSLQALLAGTGPSRLGHPMVPGPVSYACCGVVCVYRNEPFALHNPYTRVSHELPKDPEIDNSNKQLNLGKFGFGWDERSGAYKVFAAWNRFSRSFAFWCRTRVYSSKTNSWKTVEDPYSRSSIGEGKFAGGKLHWVIKKERIISSFDLKSEVFGTIELPGQIEDRGFLWLGVVGGCLCLSAEYDDYPKKAFDVWVMKEYGVTESWAKLATIHLGHEPSGKRLNFDVLLTGDAANGEILIGYGSNLLVCCPKNGVIRQRKEIGSFNFAHLCVESLVSPR